MNPPSLGLGFQDLFEHSLCFGKASGLQVLLHQLQSPSQLLGRGSRGELGNRLTQGPGVVDHSQRPPQGIGIAHPALRLLQHHPRRIRCPTQALQCSQGEVGLRPTAEPLREMTPEGFSLSQFAAGLIALREPLPKAPVLAITLQSLLTQLLHPGPLVGQLGLLQLLQDGRQPIIELLSEGIARTRMLCAHQLLRKSIGRVVSGETGLPGETELPGETKLARRDC